MLLVEYPLLSLYKLLNQKEQVKAGSYWEIQYEY